VGRKAGGGCACGVYGTIVRSTKYVVEDVPFTDRTIGHIPYVVGPTKDSGPSLLATSSIRLVPP
jgi:hypothetical protein